MSEREIARSCQCARSTVQEVLRRVRESGLSWPPPSQWDDDALYAHLYPAVEGETAASMPPLPDWAHIQAELARKGVTRLLLWQEYKAQHPDGLQYSAFCDRYAAWQATRNLVLRQSYRPGEKLFVDFAGPTVTLTDRFTGETRQASIFVAVLGYSNYTFALACAGQTSADWLLGQRAAFEFFGGVPEVVVPDNPKALVTRAHRYEPELNPAYQEFAEHYGVAVVPARVRRPQDKAKVETGVQIVERDLLAPLRDQTFFDLADLNAELARRLTQLNQKPSAKLDGCRAQRFRNDEQQHLRPLPATPYEWATWKQVKVHVDYHVQVERGYYSVPYTLIGKRVDARLTARTVELFHRGRAVALHARVDRPGQFRTDAAHRPEGHRQVVEASHERLRQRATQIGPACTEVINRQWERKLHPEQTLRSSMGILRLAKDFSPAQLEAACIKALSLNALSWRSIRALLQCLSTEAAHPRRLRPDAACRFDQTRLAGNPGRPLQPQVDHRYQPVTGRSLACMAGRTHPERLLNELPEHQRMTVTFAIVTGMRQSNVLGMTWDRIDIVRRRCWAESADVKNDQALGVPLNDIAVEIIRQQIGKHKTHVFTYKGNPVKQANTKAWKKALIRAGITDFRWHDLRHCTASWMIQSNAPESIVQAVHGWKDPRMVKRYAHLAVEHLTSGVEAIGRFLAGGDIEKKTG